MITLSTDSRGIVNHPFGVIAPNFLERTMETPKQPEETNSAEVVAPEVEASYERSRTSASEQFAPEEHDSDQSAQVATEEIPRARGRGPRTTQGKQKSKRNALKLGIFSQVVLLKGEPRAEFYSLLSKLRDDREPEGELKNIQVDKLAADLWRRRRVIIAEGAEIRRGTEFLEFDEKRRQHDQLIGYHIRRNTVRRLCLQNSKS